MGLSIFGVINQLKGRLIAFFWINFFVFNMAIDDVSAFIDTPSILLVLAIAIPYGFVTADNRIDFLPKFCNAAIIAGVIGTIVGFHYIPNVFDQSDYVFDPVPIGYSILVSLLSLFWGLFFWLNGTMLQGIFLRLKAEKDE